MEEFRRQDDFRIFVQTSGEFQRQAAGAGGDSRWTGGPVAADISRAPHLSAERPGDGADLSERARVDGVREDVLADGQWIQARLPLQGRHPAVRLGIDAARADY